ncbi:MAG: DUF547 domain-containing protein [Blastochloris sp.]|nr:DUF547 domain-containing protein [Blastochloris sp.]
MKLFLFLLCLVGTSLIHGQEPWETDYNRLLSKYVSPQGVNYGAWKANSKDLQDLKAITQAIAQQGPNSNSREARLAYLINAYNVWTLHNVLERYPVKSVRDIAPIFGFFTGDRIVVMGKKMSLNHLEKQLIIKEFKEPRIHFAVNCASVSCPPLASEAFTEKKLETQLERVTRDFLNKDEPALKVETNRVHISKIFDWYKDDFQPLGGALAYINLYRRPPLPEKMKIDYLEYDWSLNASH